VAPAQLQPEQAGGEALAVGGVGPAAAHRLHHPVVRPGEPAPDRLHHVVGVPHHRGEQDLDAGPHLLLLGGLHRPQERLGVAEHALEGAGVVEVELAEAGLHRVGVDLEAADVVLEEGDEPGPHVGPSQHRVLGDLAHAHEHAQIVGLEAPLAGEGVDVGRHHQQLVSGAAGQGQVVLAEAVAGQVPEHHPGLEAQQHRPQELAQVAQELGAGVGALGRLVAVEGGGQLLQQRPVGLQAVQRPVAPAHGQDRQDPSGYGRG